MIDLNKKKDGNQNRKSFWNEWDDIIFIVILCVVLMAFVFLVMKGIEDSKNEFNKITIRTVNLASIDYQTGVKGRFLLGSGSVAQKDYYVAYEILNDSGIQLIKLEADRTIIYQTLKDNEQAYAEISENGWGNIDTIKLYVPKGTIIQNYDLSLSNE